MVLREVTRISKANFVYIKFIFKRQTLRWKNLAEFLYTFCDLLWDSTLLELEGHSNGHTYHAAPKSSNNSGNEFSSAIQLIHSNCLQMLTAVSTSCDKWICSSTTDISPHTSSPPWHIDYSMGSGHTKKKNVPRNAVARAQFRIHTGGRIPPSTPSIHSHSSPL